MKQIFVILFLSFCSLIQAQDYCSPNLWQINEVVVDGLNEEWKEPFKYFNTAASLRFSITNDSTYLYLCFETYEPYNIVKMLRAGWALQLSSRAGKKRVNASMNFMPIMIELAPKYDYTENKVKKEPTFENWLDDYNLEGGSYTIKGFRALKKGQFLLKDTTRIRVGLNYTTAKAIYEIRIPLAELFDVNRLNYKEQLKLKLSIEAINPPTENGTLSVGTEGFSSINGRRGQVNIDKQAPNPVQKEPIDLTQKNPKSRLYHKASFSHHFCLSPAI